MGLRNAFEGLATDSLLRRLLAQMHFARDNSDRLRVWIDGGGTSATSPSRVNAGIGDTNSGNAIPLWYATIGAPFSMDPREQMKAQAHANMQQVRATRWSIT